MALPKSTVQRERDKFVEDASGNVAVRFIGSPGTGILGKVYLTDGTEDAAINPNNRLEVDLEESSLDLMLGTDFSSVFGSSSLLTATPAIKIEEQGVATTHTPYNVTLTSADTEYSQALPANTKEVRFRCRTLFDVRFAFVTGKVAGPAAPYFTLPAGSDYYSDKNDLDSITVYLASSEAGVIVELETWA